MLSRVTFHVVVRDPFGMLRLAGREISKDEDTNSLTPSSTVLFDGKVIKTFQYVIWSW